jgi:hypothetical protein
MLGILYVLFCPGCGEREGLGLIGDGRRRLGT